MCQLMMKCLSCQTSLSLLKSLLCLFFRGEVALFIPVFPEHSVPSVHLIKITEISFQAQIIAI